MKAEDTGRIDGGRQLSLETVEPGKMSGKNEFWSGKSQGILFQTKSGHPGNCLMN